MDVSADLLRVCMQNVCWPSLHRRVQSGDGQLSLQNVSRMTMSKLVGMSSHRLNSALSYAKVLMIPSTPCLLYVNWICNIVWYGQKLPSCWYTWQVQYVCVYTGMIVEWPYTYTHTYVYIYVCEYIIPAFHFHIFAVICSLLLACTHM